MGLKFSSEDGNGETRNWNLAFKHELALFSVELQDVRDTTYAYLTEYNPDLEPDNVEYVINQWEATAIRRPSEQPNKEQARIYAILNVLEAAGLTLHSEKSDFFQAYRNEKNRQRDNQKKLNKGKQLPNALDVYVSE